MLARADITPYLGSLLKFRRDIHAHPELKFEEVRTADQIAHYLASLGLQVHRGLGKTGLVASLKGKGPNASDASHALALRADMDALPIVEKNSFDHASKNIGRMHACGHDGHTAMLLGGATLLSKNPDFNGTVHFIFQPGEEGGAGAQKMIEDGLFEKFPVKAVFALHNWPPLPSGQMAVRVGPIMAATDKIEITICGKGGHAAQPHSTIDPIPVACALVMQLQTLVSRTVNPLDSAVLTIAQIEAGTAVNIIPFEAKISGTLRTLGTETQTHLLKAIERMSNHVAAAHGTTAKVELTKGYPCTDNHRDEAHFMAEIMAECVGKENAFPDVLPAMTGEDFSFMLLKVPGAYGFIGNGLNGLPGINLHTAEYDFNDDNLTIGSQFWDRLARRWFEKLTVQTA